MTSTLYLDAREGGGEAKAGVIEILGRTVAGTNTQLQSVNFNFFTIVSPSELGNQESHRSAPDTDARFKTHYRKAA